MNNTLLITNYENKIKSFNSKINELQAMIAFQSSMKKLMSDIANDVCDAKSAKDDITQLNSETDDIILDANKRVNKLLIKKAVIEEELRKLKAFQN